MEVFILRLDRIHPVVSGNKWLKLQGWIRLADRNGLRGIASRGGPWSNHLHAAAAWCYLSGRPFTAVVKAGNPDQTATLRDIASWGGNIILRQGKSFSDDSYWASWFAERGYQWVPQGADGPEGASGVTDFFNTLSAEAFDEIWCPVGTGTTISGIAASGLTAPKLVAFLPGLTDAEMVEKLRMLPTRYPDRTIVMESLPGDKFGRVQPESMACMKQWWQETGVGTDLVYTGKMITFFVRYYLPALSSDKRRILLVHTGGMQGNRSLQEGVLPFTAV